MINYTIYYFYFDLNNEMNCKKKSIYKYIRKKAGKSLNESIKSTTKQGCTSKVEKITL